MNGSSCNAGFLALVGANAIAGTTIAAGAGMGYATINGMLQGGPLSSPQQNWLGQMGMTPAQVSIGVSDGSYCNNAHSRSAAVSLGVVG
jgi:hypothetical protein